MKSFVVNCFTWFRERSGQHFELKLLGKGSKGFREVHYTILVSTGQKNSLVFIVAKHK